MGPAHSPAATDPYSLRLLPRSPRDAVREELAASGPHISSETRDRCDAGSERVHQASADLVNNRPGCNICRPARLSKAASCTAMAEEQADGLPHASGQAQVPHTAHRPVEKCEVAAPKQATAFTAHTGLGKGREASLPSKKPHNGRQAASQLQPGLSCPPQYTSDTASGPCVPDNGAAPLGTANSSQHRPVGACSARFLPITGRRAPRACVLRHISNAGLASANPLPSPS